MILGKRTMDNLDEKLAAWQQADILDAATAGRIRAYEAAHEKPTGIRWQALLALAFGAILLGAGTILFVAAHWDALSPWARFSLVIAVIAAFHIAAAFARPHFEGMGTALSAVGTVASFAAVALVGQIFNIQEHWPAGVMLCALCALAGWWLLRDQMQQTFAFLLVPAWLMCEWSDRAIHYQGYSVALERMFAVLAIVFLTAFIHSRRRITSGILFAIGAVTLPIVAVSLSDGWTYSEWAHPLGLLPLYLRLAAWVWIAAVLLVLWVKSRRAIVPTLIFILVAMALPYAHHTQIIHESYGSWDNTRPNIFAYILGALAAVLLTWWGTQLASKRTINYGVVLFALVVGWFFFSDLMDKLDRSFSLMLMGVVFLAGGWILEKLRRRLIRHVAAPEVAA